MYAFSQNGEHNNGGAFSKRIEFNHLNGDTNLDSKSEVEKRFLGGFNAPVEFFLNPSEEMPERKSAFRIIRSSSSNAYSLVYYTFKYLTESEVNDEIDSCSFPISDQFAEIMYKKMVSLIDNFKVKEYKHPDFNFLMILDSYHATFRTVVAPEVWSLEIHEPSGNALKMSDLCRQILNDIEKTRQSKDQNLDEAKYIKLLDNFDFERPKTND